jgi:hypothetical protein
MSEMIVGRGAAGGAERAALRGEKNLDFKVDRECRARNTPPSQATHTVSLAGSSLEPSCERGQTGRLPPFGPAQPRVRLINHKVSAKVNIASLLALGRQLGLLDRDESRLGRKPSALRLPR